MRQLVMIACCFAAIPTLAAAQGAPDTDQPDIVVVAPTPVPGLAISRDQIPAAVRILDDRDVNRTGIPSLTGGILEDIPSANLSDTSGNVFQPDILFRGFTASPVQGETQGLAVYVNGARFNEPFGDTVNWDVIPSSAIRRFSIEGSSPLFGLNALGGAINVQLKDGFSSPGGSATVFGGSYGRVSGILEYGRQSGEFAAYVTLQGTHDDGYRQTSASDLYQLYGDLGWRNDRASLHLSVTADDNTLGNPGASPTDLLDVSRSAAFTAPNVVYNRYVSANLRGTADITDTVSAQAVLYYANLTQRIINGVTVDFAPCTDGSGNLCNQDGTYVTGKNGQAVPDYLNGAPYGGNNYQGTNSNAFGASAQVADTADLFGYKNIAILGASLDGGNVGFDGSQIVGALDNSREILGPGYPLNDPDEGIVPVRLSTTTRYFGLFFNNVFSVTDALSVNVGGRLNYAELSLTDELGNAPAYGHNYTRFNPGAGVTYQITSAFEAYASYAEANRAPTAVELSCAGPQATCSLPNFFLGDPPLKQVVARTVEAGFRGKLAGGMLEWDADYFRTSNKDDIILVPDLIQGLSYFQNAGSTLRQGAEVNATYRSGPLLVRAGYTYIDAKFQTALTLSSPNNPAADPATGTIAVRPGSRIPGVPQHRVTLVTQYQVTPAWTVGGSAAFTSAQYFFGDEANLTKPIAPYFVLNVNTTYKLTDQISLFAVINNVFDHQYYSYGTFSSPQGVPFPEVANGVNGTRVASPAPPLTAFAGMRATF